jgi:hypothetical protein
MILAALFDGSKKLAAGVHAKLLNTNLEGVSHPFQVAAVEVPADPPLFTGVLPNRKKVLR